LLRKGRLQDAAPLSGTCLVIEALAEANFGKQAFGSPEIYILPSDFINFVLQFITGV
jgi:hypothetical protein